MNKIKILNLLIILSSSTLFTTKAIASKSIIKAKAPTKIKKESSTKKSKDFRKAYMEFPNKRKISVTLAVSEKEQVNGLTGVKDKDFKKDQGLLFYYLMDSQKGYWMPDTYFNLDVIFLDKDFKVLAIDRNLKAHPGLKEPPKIDQSRVIQCRHTLEVRSDSGLTKGLKVGSKLKFISPFSASQIESKIRQMK